MARRYLLGFDVGSSSVKASLTDVDSGEIAASALYPDHEAPSMAVKAGWAEQDPQMWWDNAKLSLQKIMAETGAKGEDILARYFISDAWLGVRGQAAERVASKYHLVRFACRALW